MTHILKVHQSNPEKRHIRTATEVLEKKGIVIVPTETGYCFVGDARVESVYERFLAMRQAHPKQKPFSLLCKDLAQIAEVAVLDTPVFRIAKKALPGPYTFILPSTHATPRFASGPKRKTVGVRMCSHEVAAALCDSFARPLLITSVTDAEELLQENYFDGESEDSDAWWTQVDEICAHYKNQVECALENDLPVPMHVSTVLDFTTDPAELVRDGGWPLTTIGFVL